MSPMWTKGLNVVSQPDRVPLNQLNKTKMNVDNIIAYESGELNDMQTLELFSELIATGFAWSLQGHYGRTASALIDRGLITSEGQITEEAMELINQ
jgi:hypothetical protein